MPSKPDPRAKVRRLVRTGKPVAVWRGWRKPAPDDVAVHGDNVTLRNPRRGPSRADAKPARHP